MASTINRDYLPYISAREYQDRNMMKWMGFFISEHTTALNDDSPRVDFSLYQEEEDKLNLISHSFLAQLKIRIFTTLFPEPFICKIHDIFNGSISLKIQKRFYTITYDQILMIDILENDAYDYEQEFNEE